MDIIDQHFEEALQDLPEQKLSWRANHRVRKMLTQRAREMEGRISWVMVIQRLVAVPMALVVVLASTSAFAFYSPGVVRGDFLYPVKPALEEFFYPETGTSEERIAFHLWLSDRRYGEANEILRRLGKEPVAFLPAAHAQTADDQGGAQNALDQALVDTLQSALEHQDYALLISGEIRDIKRVEAVQGDIRRSIEKHKAFVDKVSPILAEVKLVRKEMALQKTVSEIEPVESNAGPATLPFASVVQKPAEIDRAGELVQDHLDFQQSLLDKDKALVDEATNQGQPDVTLNLDEPFSDDAQAPTDQVLSRALKAHYQETKRVLTQEVGDQEQQTDQSNDQQQKDQQQKNHQEKSDVVKPFVRPDFKDTLGIKKKDWSADDQDKKKKSLQQVEKKLRDFGWEGSDHGDRKGR